ncbi:alpha/beta hydrolase family protein [Pleionea sediminis]|uniref:alpha/beta hydrolase family protein n=1 Tax=Pleionea sediminis TaxID=2569479 RepID=UPI00197C3920|nr:S9 family peptidase [Pleionea sediminis]
MKTFSPIIYALIMMCVLLNPVAAKRVMTLEETVMTQYVGGSYIAPNGKYTAYTLVKPIEVYKDEDGKHRVELHVVDSAGNSRPFITGKVAVSNVQWSPDSQYIYYTSKRNDDKYTSIYRIPIDGGESMQVVSHGNGIGGFSINSESNKLVFIAKDPKDANDKKLKKKGFKAEVYEEDAEFSHLYLVNLNNLEGKPKKLAMERHVLSVAFHPKKDQLLLRTTPTPHIDDNYTASVYGVFDLEGDNLETFKTEGKLGGAKWSPDGKYVAIIGAEDKNDPADGRLFVGRASNGSIDKVLPNYMGHVKDVDWTSDYQVVYMGHKGTSSEIGVINLDNKKSQTLLPLGKGALRSIDVSADGKQMVGTMGTSEHPREVFQITEGNLKRLTQSNDWLKDIKMPKQESITYKARDGVELGGILVYPINYKKGKSYPLIMMVHGGPESHISNEWLDRYSYPIKHATGNGFAVFLPNYRGSTGRGVEFSKLGQADYAGKEFNDLVDAITHLSEQGIVNKERVGITGGSYGGYASAWGATALSEHFAASVMFVGISNQLSKFGTTDIPKEMYNVHARNYPWDKWQWMLERSPIYHTDKAKTPLLIMHGKEDTRVHPAQSMELYRYIKTRTETPVRLVYYPGEGHGNRKAPAQLDYSQRLMRWMEFYLKGKKKGNKIPPYELNHSERLKADNQEKD